MNENVQVFVEQFNESTIDCQKFCFMARGKEFQEEAVQKLVALKQQASDLKAELIASCDEQSANLLLSLEEAIEALCYELRMWIALKEDDPNSAWDCLISAQSAMLTAIQSHSAVSHLEGYVQRLHFLEKILFPPQTFLSPGIVIEESKCSICGEEYGECDHLKGKPYMGRICAKEITKAKIRECSLVEEPANRHARILRFTDGGITRDVMTWRIITETPNEIVSD
ncbi:MAG: hypothetical protein L0229_04875 [Blastocatellia bacterium]|nr:hypothetical protein [Blastocatellia bacterium]